jgi:hypothetical protein
VVTIDGTIDQKSEASILITEKLELFKNGGPVSTNDNKHI